MALAYLYDPLKQWQDVRGVNNVNGWLEVFISGTQERAVAYSDFGGTLLPDRIGIDNDGRAVVIVDSEKAYRVEVHTANGDLLFTQYPVWTQQSGGGVIGSFVDIESSNGSLDVQKTVVGATTIYDLSVATDSTEGLDWIRTNGYTTADGKLVPTYQDGTMEVGEYGIRLHGWRYYHVTARLVASVTAMPYYNEFTVTFSGKKAMGGTESYVTRNFVADCSTQLTQQYEVSFDVMPNNGDAELYATVSGLLTGVSVGLLDIEVHRVYSGIPDIPDGMATREWVRGNFQPTLSVSDGLELSGSFLSVDYSDVQEKLTAGDNITIENNVISATVPEFAEADWDAASGEPGYIHNKPDLSVYATEAELADKQDVLTAGDSISIENNVISAIIPEYADADWIAASGEPGFIHNKPTFIPGDNIWINQGPYAITIGEIITPKNADWAATSGIAEILNKPNLASVATTGNYADLMDRPDLSVYATQSDLSTGLAGKQDTLTAGNNITITNNVISATAEPQVNADWDATSGVAEILNKPTEKTLVAGENITITDSVSTVTIAATVFTQVNSDWDATSGVAQILNKPDLSIYAQSANLATVATTGDYDDLLNKPAIPAAQVNSDWDATSGAAEILNKPDLSIYAQSSSLSTVATTGDYDDLLNKPSIPAAQVNTDWDATSGVAQLLNKPDLSIYAESSSLSPVATSGSYNDLTDTPTIPEGLPPYNPGTDEGKVLTVGSSTPYWNTPAEQVNADWDATSGKAQILNKPDLSIYAQSSSLSTVATTGDYDDLLNKPSIPAAQVNSDWDATSGKAQILNKPDLSIYAESSSLSTVATTGDYDDLLNKPTIPEAQVNADWNASSGVAAILNKPVIPEGVPSYTTSEDGKVLGVIDNSGTAELQWVPQTGGGGAQADWDATSGAAEILNKPEPKTLVAGTGIIITESSSELTVSSTNQLYNAGTGLKLTNATFSLDETVLFSSANGENLKNGITLSESRLNFNRLRITYAIATNAAPAYLEIPMMGVNTGAQFIAVLTAPFDNHAYDVAGYSLVWFTYFADCTDTYLKSETSQFVGKSGFIDGTTAGSWAQGVNNNVPIIYEVVGVNRIAP